MKEIFRQILYIPFYNLLIFFAFLTNGSIGWAIVFLTFIIRIILLPPSLKAARSTTLMQALQPQMNEIKKRYKDDQKKQNEEIMKVYKQSGTSPLGCCLPFAIQFLVIIILYRVFLIGFDTSRYNLLYSFTPHPDHINTFFLGINMAKPDLWVLPIIAGLTQLVLSIMTMPKGDKTKTADPTQAMTKQMTYLFPILTVFIGRSLQSGLVLYWIITTIFSIGQQWYVNKKIRNSKSEILNSKQAQNSQIQNDNQLIDKPKLAEEKTGPKKKDLVTGIMKKRLDKTDRKKGIEISIRKKQ